MARGEEGGAAPCPRVHTPSLTHTRYNETRSAILVFALGDASPYEAAVDGQLHFHQSHLVVPCPSCLAYSSTPLARASDTHIGPFMYVLTYTINDSPDDQLLS